MPVEVSGRVRAGDLVRIVSLDQCRYRARQSPWLVGHLARVLFAPAQGVWAEVELLAEDLPYGRRREWQLHVGGLQVLHTEDVEQGRPARPPRAGDRATIVGVLHSHARARAHEHGLVSQRGVIVRLLREGSYALVELDDPPSTLLGVRRWHLHVDDLRIEPVEPRDHVSEPVPGVGLAAGTRHAIKHAIIPADPTIARCGASVRPVLVDGWSPPFSPALERACPDCSERYCSPDTLAGSR